MSYTKQTWATGDVITADKMNHMEDGIAEGGGFLAVEMDVDSQSLVAVLNKTWNEIAEASLAVTKDNSGGIISFLYAGNCSSSEGVYEVSFINLEGIENPMIFYTDSADGYPTTVQPK